MKRGVLLAGTAAAFVAPALPTAVRADDTETVGIANSLSELHIVADKGSAPMGYGFTAILVRSDLVKSGK